VLNTWVIITPSSLKESRENIYRSVKGKSVILNDGKYENRGKSVILSGVIRGVIRDFEWRYP
jgi:hypothetical protein